MIDETEESEELEDPSYYEGLSVRERRFVEEYCKDCNATQAAIRAGYSENTASTAVLGSRKLRKAKVLAAINARLSELSMHAIEAIKHTSDIARTRLNDFLKEEKVLHTPRVQKHLSELIDEIKLEIIKADEFAAMADIDDKETLRHTADQRDRQRKILRYEIELRHDPDATAEVAGEPVLVDDVRIDMVSLARAKDVGRIKSLSYGEFGPKVEMYDASAALIRILEMAGKFPHLFVLTGPDGGPIKVENNNKRTWTLLDHTGGKPVPAPDEAY